VTLLAEVAGTSARVAETPSRLAKVRELATCMRQLEPGEIEIAIPYLSGEIRQGKLSVGFGALESVRGTPNTLAVLKLSEVDSIFQELKLIKGKGAAAQRLSALKRLFEQATAEEQDFLFRLLMGELRQGALEGLMHEAVAVAAGLPAAAVRRAASFAGGIAEVARVALTEGAPALSRFAIRLMQPVLPMLAQPAADAESALAQLGEAQLEWKLDGARVQVHKSGDEVRVFTRSLNEVTAAVPEVVAVARTAPGRSLILDGEAIALRPDGKPQPFQLTMRRFGRKLDDEAMRRELPLSVFFFDCLLAEEVPFVDRPLIERRQALERSVPSANVTPSIVTADAAKAAAFYADALRHGHEGIMAKALDAP
jgi:DNA ligase 1